MSLMMPAYAVRRQAGNFQPATLFNPPTESKMFTHKIKPFRAAIEAIFLCLMLFCAAMIPGVKYASDSAVLGVIIGCATVLVAINYFCWRAE
jgi:hypothetical protein